MALVNYSTREINAKIVYYGPGLSGKTTNIQFVFQRVKPKNKGKLISLSTQGDRTLFFDFLPDELGEIKGFKTRFHLYTVPGQVFYNSTRKLVLKGADGVIFVADSQKMMMEENLQSFENLKTNLRELGLKTESFPIVIQYNKRDLEEAADIEEMDRRLNPDGLPWFEATAIKGEGVLQTLTAMVKSVLQSLKQDTTGDLLGLEEIEEEAKPEAAPEEGVVSIKGHEPQKAPEISVPEMAAPAAALAAGIQPGEEAVAAPEPEMPAVAPQSEQEPQEPPEPEGEEIHEAEFAELEELTEAPIPDIDEGGEETLPQLRLEEPDFAAIGEPGEIDNLPPDELPSDADISDFGKTDFHVEELIAKGLEAEAVAEPSIPEYAGNEADSAADSAAAADTSGPDLREDLKDDLHAVLRVNSAQSFILPIRIRTLTGIKDVQLKVNIGVELSGDKIEDISAVEIMKPVPREPYSPPPYSPSARVELSAEERPHRAPIKPKADLKDKDRKPNMFQKLFLGMK